MKIKVLMVGADLVIGGIPNYVSTIASLCDPANVEFHMTVSGPGDSKVAARFDNIIKHYQPIDYSLIKLPSRMIQLHRLLRQECIDVMHLHAARAGLLGCLSVWGLPVRIVYTGHGWRFTQKSGIFKQSLYKLYEYLICRRSDVVTFIMDSHRRIGLEHRLITQNRAVTILTRIDARKFEHLSPEVGFRKKADYGIPEHAPVVGMIGRLVDQKDPFTFVRAGAEILAMFPSAYLLWVGDGKLRHSVASLADRLGLSDKLVITGFRPQKEIPAFLNAMDVLLCTSIFEGLPLGILEAQAAHCPVVSCAFAGSEKIIVHKKTGYCFPPADSSQAAEYVKRILRNPEIGASLAQAAYESFYRQHSDVNQMAKDFEQIYHQCVKV